MELRSSQFITDCVICPNYTATFHAICIGQEKLSEASFINLLTELYNGKKPKHFLNEVCKEEEADAYPFWMNPGNREPVSGLSAAT